MPLVFYPLFMDLRDRPVLVVGGGAIAERKVESLLEAGAAVTLVAPEVTPDLRALADSGSIRSSAAQNSPDADLDGALLVISATDDPAIQEQVAICGPRAKHPCQHCRSTPAVRLYCSGNRARGDVVAGDLHFRKSPALAAALRAKLDSVDHRRRRTRGAVSAKSAAKFIRGFPIRIAARKPLNGS